MCKSHLRVLLIEQTLCKLYVLFTKMPHKGNILNFKISGSMPFDLHLLRNDQENTIDVFNVCLIAYIATKKGQDGAFGDRCNSKFEYNNKFKLEFLKMNFIKQ